MSITSRLLENTMDYSITLEAIFYHDRCFDTSQKSSKSYIATDDKRIKVSPNSATEKCKTKHAEVVKPSCFGKACNACVIRQQMKKFERYCGANLLLLLSAFPFSQGWPQRIIILQTFLSST